MNLVLLVSDQSIAEYLRAVLQFRILSCLVLSPRHHHVEAIDQLRDLLLARLEEGLQEDVVLVDSKFLACEVINTMIDEVRIITAVSLSVTFFIVARIGNGLREHHPGFRSKILNSL